MFASCCSFQWLTLKPTVIMMPTLSTLTTPVTTKSTPRCHPDTTFVVIGAPQAVITATHSTTSDKVGILTTLGIQCRVSSIVTQPHSSWVHVQLANCSYIIDNAQRGPVSLTICCPQFKFDGNFALLYFCCWPSDRNKFLHMPRQHSCRAMYKILWRLLY